jgi:phosphoribosylglycinamide formyltransferase 1
VKRARVVVLISGRGSNMAALLYAAKAPNCPYEIVLVTGDRPDAAGFDLAEREGIPVVRIPAPTPKDKSQFFQALDLVVRRSEAQYIALAGFMRILPPSFVENWEGRMLNIHPSLLPKYKGLDAHARALAAGDVKAGCSVHLVTAELDDGDVLGQTEVAVLPTDTPESLAARVLIAEHQLYPRILAEFVARETGRGQ